MKLSHLNRGAFLFCYTDGMDKEKREEIVKKVKSEGKRIMWYGDGLSMGHTMVYDFPKPTPKPK